MTDCPQSKNNLRYHILILTVLVSCSPKGQYEEVVGKADILNGEGRYAEAIKLYNEAAELKDGDKVLYNNRSAAYFRLGKYAEAVSDINKAMKLDSNAVTLGNRAHYCLVSGNYEKAIADYNTLIPYDSSAEKFNNRGLSYFYNGEIEKALWDYKHALKLDSSYSESYNNLSLIYVNNKEFGLAVQTCTESLIHNPNNIYAYSNRGWANNFLGNHHEAIGDFNKALEIDSSFLAAYVNRAISHAALGNLGSACRDYKKAKKLGLVDLQENLEELCEKTK